MALIERVRPDVVKLDTCEIVREEPVRQLLSSCEELGVRVIFKRVENADTVETLTRIAVLCGMEIQAQGFIWDLPNASLTPHREHASPIQGSRARRVGAG